MTAVAGYDMPNGINIAGLRSQAVPRKTGAYDMEGFPSGTVKSQLVLFQNSTGFGQTLTSLTSKVYGRDTNITSKSGGMALGERLYAYGISAKLDAGDQAINSAANVVILDQWRRLWGIADVEIRLGSDEFIRCQARDIPLAVPRVPFHTFTDTLTWDLSVEGMYDITVGGDPYIFDQQEDFRINFNVAPQNLSLTLETHLTLRLEGVRIKAVRT